MLIEQILPGVALRTSQEHEMLVSYRHAMTRLERNVNLAAVFVPIIGIAVAVPLLWGNLLGPTDVAIAVTLYLITGFGITIGYHRLLTHRSFQTHRATEYVFATMGALALQGSPLDWVADHRKHHAHTDEEGDPHSPHAGQGSGVRGALSGLWHAHVGWLWQTQGQAESRKYAKELAEDPVHRAMHRNYLWFAIGTLALPFGLGFAISGTLHGALTALLWGGLVRTAALHHITWSINSLCHFFGSRRFDVNDHSTNVAWLALPSLGEAWHHNHHAFSRSAYHGLRGWERFMDPTAWVIRGLSRTGLAWNVVAITPERQEERLAVRSAAPQEPQRLAA
jgi:stearoyl-CoA desaturase (delta-9 desaturase)